MAQDENREEAPASSRAGNLLVTPLVWVAGAISAAMILIMVVVTIYAIVMRYIFNKPLLWADEVTGWSLVAIVMLGAAEAYRRGDHIAIDILSHRLSGRAAMAMELIGHLAVLGFAVVVGWSTWDAIEFARAFGSYTAGHIEIETWYLQVPILVGAVLLGLVATQRVLELVFAGRRI